MRGVYAQMAERAEEERKRAAALMRGEGEDERTHQKMYGLAVKKTPITKYLKAELTGAGVDPQEFKRFRLKKENAR